MRNIRKGILTFLMVVAMLLIDVVPANAAELLIQNQEGTKETENILVGKNNIEFTSPKDNGSSRIVHSIYIEVSAQYLGHVAPPATFQYNGTILGDDYTGLLYVVRYYLGATAEGEKVTNVIYGGHVHTLL